jgi:diguanylate cyclase (GGDEF)-like protein
MKKMISAVAILLGCGWSAYGAAVPPLTSVRAIRALSNAAASQALPVSFEATVTYDPGYDSLLFVQDGDAALFVLNNAPGCFQPGDRVLVRGATQASFRPIVVSTKITLLGHGALPDPVPATFDELIQARLDGALVRVRGVVRTVEMGWSSQTRVIYLQILMDGGYVEAMVDSSDEKALQGLLDAEVEITGIAGGRFDNKMQLTGILLHISSLDGLRILKQADTSLASIPVTPMDKIFSFYHVQNQSRRIRVRGTITYYQSGLAVVLQDGKKSIWVATPTRGPLRIGDVADAVGFPDPLNGFLALNHAQVEDSGIYAPISPQKTNWRDLGFWSANRPDGHLYDLVSIEGQLVAEVRGAMQDEYVVVANGRLFSAIYSHPDMVSHLPLPTMKVVAPGSRIRVSGICILDATSNYNTDHEVPFHILIRSFDDIAVVAGPSPINTRNLLLALGLALLVIIAGIARGWALDRKVRRQTVAISTLREAEADLERQRSRILEEINGARPLGEILQKITEMVSSTLRGAHCWCETADGVLGGYRPQEMHGLRIVRASIETRTGPELGVLFAAFDALTQPLEREAEALRTGARLASLAVETRRLYNDLHHRSEYDLLTDIHNRFSLEKLLDLHIARAMENGEGFGLIYIDLDRFKEVNDRYGHHFGDLYLQNAVLRMKRQLRGRDTLARLGGDEFAVLVAEASVRTGVEEVAERMKHCFDSPFAIDGHTLQGTASFGVAIYPEDGTNRDALLNSADAAMYVAKNIRKEKNRIEANTPALSA